jgi:hypothetical protein
LARCTTEIALYLTLCTARFGSQASGGNLALAKEVWQLVPQETWHGTQLNSIPLLIPLLQETHKLKYLIDTLQVRILSAALPSHGSVFQSLSLHPARLQNVLQYCKQDRPQSDMLFVAFCVGYQEELKIAEEPSFILKLLDELKLKLKDLQLKHLRVLLESAEDLSARELIHTVLDVPRAGLNPTAGSPLLMVRLVRHRSSRRHCPGRATC